MPTKTQQSTQQRNKDMKTRIQAETQVETSALPDGVTGDDVYYRGPVSNGLSRNGANASLELTSGQTIEHYGRSGDLTVLDTDGYLAEKTVPNDALTMNLLGYNLLPRRYSIPNNANTLTGAETAIANDFFGNYVWEIPADTEVFLAGSLASPAEGYPIIVESYVYFVFTALVKHTDDVGILVRVYNQDDDLVQSYLAPTVADEWIQITRHFDASSFLGTRLTVSLTPVDASCQVAAAAVYPIDNLSSKWEPPPFSQSPNFRNAITRDDIVDEAINGAKIADDAVGTNQIAAGAVTTTQILDGTITATDCNTSLTDRLFTSSAKKTAVEALESSGGVAANKVSAGSITDGVVSRTKLSHMDGNMTGNLLPAKWQSYKGATPFAVHTGGGTGPWLTNNGTASYLDRTAFKFNIVTTPTTGGESRCYFGDSATDYNIPLYTRATWHSTNPAYNEAIYLVIIATAKCDGSWVTNRPVLGIRNAAGTDLTNGGSNPSLSNGVYVQYYQHFNLSTQVTSNTTGIAYIEQPARQTVGTRNLDLVDLQVFYTSKLPSNWVGSLGGPNQYQPNLIQSIIPNDIFPSHSLVPIGSILPYGGSSAPTGWVLCDGATYATATYPYLYGVIGYTFGGSGANFNVPDLRDRVPGGKSGTNALASTAGNDALTTYEIEYTTGASAKVLVDGETGTANDNRQATIYLNYIIKAN